MTELRDILEKLAKGDYTVEEAETKLRIFNIIEVAHLAKLDVHRETRKGIPEVIFAQNKTVSDLVEIIKAGIAAKPILILSKVSVQQQQALKEFSGTDLIFEVFGEGEIAIIHKPDYHPRKTGGKIGIIAAGTSDRNVAEAARIMGEQMGCQVFTTYDVGVAGVHRLFPELEEMVEQGIDILIVVAGMEGALPSLVTGLVDTPVIGLPISTGYGLGGEGLGALISMLQSCSLGLAVVNIDNGIGAGAIAALIANRIAQK
ncbi:MAG: nickel pincer cofactor biosynthesis protein LarB [Promethearchaeota archaeon]